MSISEPDNQLKGIDYMNDYNTNEEIYKDIKDYEGLYMVSNLGNVKSLDRISHNNRGPYVREGRVLKAAIVCGYSKVALINEQRKYKAVHRLVAEAFISNDDNDPQVNHIDGDKQNNELTNLEWCTSGYNHLHAYSTGLRNSKSVSKKVKQYTENGDFVAVFESIRSASRETGVKPSMISRVCNGKQYMTQGFVWKFE